MIYIKLLQLILQIERKSYVDQLDCWINLRSRINAGVGKGGGGGTLGKIK